MSQQDFKEQVAITSHTSNTFRKLGKFMEDNWVSIGMLNATEVAKRAGVSQGSVTRFCNQLGFAGYSEFSKRWKESIYEPLTAPDRLKNIREEHADLAQIIEVEQKQLDRLPEIVAGSHYQAIAKQLAHQKKIVLMSARISATLLDEIHYTLSKIRDNVQVVTPQTPEWNNLILEDPADVFIFTIMFPRYPNILIKELKELHEAGFEIGLMTNSMMCPMIPYVKYHIEVPVSSNSIFDSYGTPTVLLNYLIRDIAGQTAGLEERLNRLEAFEKENDVYYTERR
ncbi:MAG: MurR/RpiR family transcriptional regulator [Lachnospiraceae bacterium]